MGFESLIFAGLSAAGGIMSTRAANQASKQNAMAAAMEVQGQYEQVGVQNEQLLQEKDLIRIAAEGQFNERLQQLQKVKENNALFLSSSGLSFNQAEETARRVSDRKAYSDIQGLEFQASAQRQNIAQQIGVNRMSLKYAGYKAAASIQNSVHQAQGVAQQAVINTLGAAVKYAPPGTFGTQSLFKMGTG